MVYSTNGLGGIKIGQKKQFFKSLANPRNAISKHRLAKGIIIHMLICISLFSITEIYSLLKYRKI